MSLLDTLQAQLDYCKQQGWLDLFRQASEKHSIRLELLLALASRETGIKNIIGDSTHGKGLMQIDDRYHGAWLKDPANKNGLDVANNLDYGTKLLSANIKYFKGDELKGICAYNAGVRGVERALRRGKDPNLATTGGNYGKDVLARADGFKQLLANSNS